jgi:acyl-CoA thioesterase I
MKLRALTLLFILSACEPPQPPLESAAPTDPPREALSAGETDLDRPTVVFLGTSLTAGLGLLDPDDRYTEQIALLASAAGRPVRVVNAGVSGETSAGGLRRLDWVLREPLDVLVVELGANDGLRGQDPRALADNLRAIIGRVRERHPAVRVVLLGMEAPRNLGDDYTRAFREVYPRVARGEGVALVPFLLAGVAGDPALNQGDRIHPTAEGHRRMAETVWPVLDSVLQAPRRTP